MRLLLVLALLVSSAPSLAQDLDPVRVEKRVGRLESEMRAVQRKVFPGGDPKFFDPEIAPATAAPPAPLGTAASAPLADLGQRVGELERQLRELTGQIEANQFKLRQVEEAQTRLRGDVEFRLDALEGKTAPPPAAAALDAPLALPPRPTPETAPARPVAPKAVAAKPAPTTPEAAWRAAYANALARNWPATSGAMAAFIAAHPKSTRIPQARYWLGRAHAERAQHAEAAKAFLEVYQTAPRSDRAPDSLLGLATAMNGLKKPKDACRVLGELDSVYAEKLTPAQTAEIKTLRTRAKCTA